MNVVEYVWAKEQIELIKWLQRNVPSILQPILANLSLLGSKYVVYIALIAFWGSRYPSVALNLAKMISISGMAIGCIKMLVAEPRPHWIDKDIQHLDPTAESSFSFPSGHATVAAVVITFAFFVPYLAALEDSSKGRKKDSNENYSSKKDHRVAFSIKICLIMVQFLLCFSRVYTGSHFVHDTLIGTILGILVVVIDLYWLRNHFNCSLVSKFSQNSSQQISFFCAVKPLKLMCRMIQDPPRVFWGLCYFPSCRTFHWQDQSL